MKTIGFVGGTGWVSTVEYYRLLNMEINKRLGGQNAARCILYSFNYNDIYELNQKNDHANVLKLVVEAIHKLEGAGVDGIVLCANTLHYYADDIQKQISKPIIHIASATAEVINKREIARVGLLGTKITMEESFYKNKLKDANIETLIPEARERAFIHRSIFNELIKSDFKGSTKNEFINIINKLRVQGANGIILGCTEIPLLIKQEDVELPVFNTLEIHVNAIADFALNL